MFATKFSLVILLVGLALANHPARAQQPQAFREGYMPVMCGSQKSVELEAERLGMIMLGAEQDADDNTYLFFRGPDRRWAIARVENDSGLACIIGFGGRMPAATAKEKGA